MARSHPRMVCTACVRHLYTIRDCESSAFLKHVTFLWESSQCRSSLCFSGLDLGCNENRLRARFDKTPEMEIGKEIRNQERKKKPLAPRVDMYMVYIDFSQRNSVICTLCFFLFMVLNRVLKQLSLFEEGKGREGTGGGGDHEALRTCC